MADYFFAHIARTGGMSIKNALKCRYEKNDTFKHDTLSRFLARGVVHDDTFIFAFTRNPYRRTLSYFLHRHEKLAKKKGLTSEVFEQWLRDFRDEKLDKKALHALVSQYDILYVNGQQRANFLGRYEQYDQDVARLMEETGIEAKAKIAHAHDMKSHEFLRLLTPAAQTLIRGLYGKDFKVFGYSTVWRP